MNPNPIRILACPLLAVLLGGCLFQHTNDDASIRPETAMGTAATIMMPNDGAPPMMVFGQPDGARGSSGSTSSSGGSQRGSSTSSGSSTGSGSSSGSSAGGGGGMTMLGGTVGEGDASSKIKSTPVIGPILSLVGYPFWVFRSNEAKADRAAEKRAEKYAKKQATPGQRVARSADDAERMRLEHENERIRQQLSQRRAARPAGIREELAALERSLGGSSESGPTPEPVQARLPEAREGLDRNHDGRPDLWAYREEGQRTREELDDNYDGEVDRVLHYDDLQRLLRTEEDLDWNGSFETVTHYLEGEMSRRRADADDDGQADSWSFYSGGEMARHEVDRDKDGFRDLIMIYQDGSLVREEDDRNRDGRPDLVLSYQDGAVVEKHEDLDFDGLPDITSYYEGGKLVRRTVSSEGALEPWSSGHGP